MICVTAGFGGADAGFYNSGEIQVRGPLTEFTWTPVKQGEFGDAAGLDAVPSESDTAKYTAEHGPLRHALIEQALATAGPAGQERLTQARASGGSTPSSS